MKRGKRLSKQCLVVPPPKAQEEDSEAYPFFEVGWDAEDAVRREVEKFRRRFFERYALMTPKNIARWERDYLDGKATTREAAEAAGYFAWPAHFRRNLWVICAPDGLCFSMRAGKSPDEAWDLWLKRGSSYPPLDYTSIKGYEGWQAPPVGKE